MAGTIDVLDIFKFIYGLKAAKQENEQKRELQLAQIANLKAEEDYRKQLMADKSKELALGERVVMPEQPEREEIRPETPFKPDLIPSQYKPHPQPLALRGGDGGGIKIYIGAEGGEANNVDPYLQKKSPSLLQQRRGFRG